MTPLLQVNKALSLTLIRFVTSCLIVGCIKPYTIKSARQFTSGRMMMGKLWGFTAFWKEGSVSTVYPCCVIIHKLANFHFVTVIELYYHIYASGTFFTCYLPVGIWGCFTFSRGYLPAKHFFRSRQNPILKISNFPANSGKVRYPNEKVPSAYITRRPERECAILVDPPRASTKGYSTRLRLVDILRYLSLAGKISANISLSHAGRRTIYMVKLGDF